MPSVVRPAYRIKHLQDIEDLAWHKPAVEKETKTPSLDQQRELTNLILRYTQDKYSMYNLLLWEMDGSSVVLTLGNKLGTMVIKVPGVDLFSYTRSLEEKEKVEKQMRLESDVRTNLRADKVERTISLTRTQAEALRKYINKRFSSFLLLKVECTHSNDIIRIRLKHKTEGHELYYPVALDELENLDSITKEWADLGDTPTVLGVDIPYFGTENDYVKSGLR